MQSWTTTGSNEPGARVRILTTPAARGAPEASRAHTDIDRGQDDMTNDTHTKARLGLILAVAIIGAAGCGRCGAEPDAPSVTEVPESGDGFQAFGAEGSAEAPEEPQRPRIVHETPPTPGDFTVAPVTGDWATFRGDQTRSGLREVHLGPSVGSATGPGHGERSVHLRGRYHPVAQGRGGRGASS